MKRAFQDKKQTSNILKSMEALKSTEPASYNWHERVRGGNDGKGDRDLMVWTP